MDLFRSNVSKIQGLTYIQNYITKTQEEKLINKIDSKEWINDLKRRTQHYGYKYDYKARKITDDLKIGVMPDWLHISDWLHICEKIYPDQVIINEYLSGQGIAPHIDLTNCFGDTICALSLLKDCTMIFEKETQKLPVILEARSLVIMTDEARYKWEYSIPARKSNIKNRRVSIAFRTVIL